MPGSRQISLQEALAKAPWRPLRNCPGRWALSPSFSSGPPAELLGCEAESEEFDSAAPDRLVVTRLREGALLSYRKADGRYLHTLNTPEGLARKLKQLGVA